MPQPRRLTDEQEDQALADFRAANGRRGVRAQLARDHLVSWPSMNDILKRAARREEIKVSHETLKAMESQL